MKRWQPQGPVKMGAAAKGKPRYPNRRVKREVRGELRTFDSKGEHKRFVELALMERAGLISNLQPQVVFAIAVVRTSFVEELVAAARELALKAPDTPAAAHVAALLGRYGEGLETVYVTSYKADAVYLDKRDGDEVVEDYKDNILAEVYRIKRSLMDAANGIRIREVGPARTGRGRPRKIVR